MASTVVNGSAVRHRLLPEKSGEPVKADLRKAENNDLRPELGAALDEARREVGWTLGELAWALRVPGSEKPRDERQIARWIAGTENLQVHVVFGVPDLQAPFVVALARRAGQAVEITTQITVRRTA